MKKSLYILLFLSIFLSGCEKKTAQFAPASLFLLQDQVTAAGITVGDSPKAFQKAYGDYTIQVAFRDQPSNYRIMDIDNIPYKESISTLIANFFIDDEPISVEALCSENKVSPAELPTLLSSPDYLRRHDVVYRYLDFQWKDGVIASIHSEELNYNETYETPRLD